MPAINKKQIIWQTELKHLVKTVPEFEEVKKTVGKHLIKNIKTRV